MTAIKRGAKLIVRVTPEVREAAERAAADDRRTLSSLTEKALADWLAMKGYLPGPGSVTVPDPQSRRGSRKVT